MKYSTMIKYIMNHDCDADVKRQAIASVSLVYAEIVKQKVPKPKPHIPSPLIGLV